MTTNGVLIAGAIDALVANGLDRMNVSIDSLDPERFAAITRRDDLARVREGLAACERHPSLRPIKVNAVALRGVSEPDVLPLAQLARERPYVVRFIEVMPLDAPRAWTRRAVLSSAELRAMIGARWPLQPMDPERPSATGTRWRFADGAGELQFISSVTEPFCATCDRLRLTADGQLRTCLFAEWETDLRGPLRAGASDDQLARDRPRGRLAQGCRARHGRPRLDLHRPPHEHDRRMTPGGDIPLAGIVLAGGRSSRMGADKAGIAWQGSTLLARVVGALAPVCGQVVVVHAPGAGPAAPAGRRAHGRGRPPGPRSSGGDARGPAGDRARDHRLRLRGGRAVPRVPLRRRRPGGARAGVRRGRPPRRRARPAARGRLPPGGRRRGRGPPRRRRSGAWAPCSSGSRCVWLDDLPGAADAAATSTRPPSWQQARQSMREKGTTEPAAPSSARAPTRAPWPRPAR